MPRRSFASITPGSQTCSCARVRTLAYLHRNPGSCLFRLADYLGVTRPTASAIVERLVRRGMVTRAENPQERRQVILELTPLGTRHFRRSRHSTQLWMVNALSRLDPARLRQILQGVTLLEEPFVGSANEVAAQEEFGRVRASRAGLPANP